MLNAAPVWLLISFINVQLAHCGAMESDLRHSFIDDVSASTGET